MASRRIEDLVPEMQAAARSLMTLANGSRLGPGVTCMITCTLRSREEQAALYAQGRTTQGPRIHKPSECGKCLPGQIGHTVTGGKPGETYHEHGRAFDVMLLRFGKPIPDASDPAWLEFGRIVQEHDGLCWGGAWRRKDACHVEMHPAGLGCRDAARLARPRTEIA